MRLVNPSAEIRVAGGRGGNLRGMQGLALYPANSLFVDGYLTTRGESLNDTFSMIEDAGFEVAEIEGEQTAGAEGVKALCNRGRAADVAGRAADSASRFSVPGGGEELLRPELVRRVEP